ncbi:MAG: exp8 [Bacillales bacterium]|jgi:ATP-binding cassette subfamily B protein|nr:exp8 [Bacillales bacterium]
MTNQNDTQKIDEWKVLKRLLSYAKSHKLLVLSAFAFLLVTTLGEIFAPLVVKKFIDDHLTKKEFVLEPMLFLAVAFFSIHLVKMFMMYFQFITFQKIALKIIQQLRIDVFSKVQRLGLRYFDQTPAGSIVSRITNDTEAVKDMFVSVIASFVQSAFMITGIFISMFVLNAKLAFFCLSIVPIIYGIIRTYRYYSGTIFRDMRERLSQINAKLAESLQGMSVVQIFRQEERLRSEFEDINDKHYQAVLKNIKLESFLTRPAIDLVAAFSLLILVSFFGVKSINGYIEIGLLYTFVNYIGRFFEPINDVMVRMAMFQQALVAGSRVFTIVDHPELAPAPTKETDSIIDEGDVEFKNLSFSYDGKKDVLKNISFKVKKGETVALVGQTGSGKSSIINVLMRFYDFDRGEILIDGVSIKNYRNSELRSKTGLVLQDPFLFFGTIKDNIRLHNKKLTDEKIIEAAKFVQADQFIEKLEKKYDHEVVERGSTYSSGQRQLIAFARTVAANPKILILDEATANIDTETEEAIQTGLKKLREGRTTIAIAHRLSTIQDANLILVLHHGEIVERGTHQELLTQKGLYYKMYLLQNGLVEQSA